MLKVFQKTNKNRPCFKKMRIMPPDGINNIVKHQFIPCYY